jgi:hypothetical protein
MKKRHWKREVRYLYLMLLKNNHRIINIEKAIGYYDQYSKLEKKAQNDPDCPEAIRARVVGSVIMPLYLYWAKEYIVEEDEDE